MLNDSTKRCHVDSRVAQRLGTHNNITWVRLPCVCFLPSSYTQNCKLSFIFHSSHTVHYHIVLLHSFDSRVHFLLFRYLISLFFILIYNLQNIDTLFRNTKKGPSFAWITRYYQPTSKQKSERKVSLDPANKWIALRCRIGWIKWFALASLPLPEIGWLSLMERVKTNLKKHQHQTKTHRTSKSPVWARVSI